jgi:hypothetical protein
MKTFKAICATAVLALSLSIPAYADSTNPGDGHSPGGPCSDPTETGDLTPTPDAASVDGNLSILTLTDILWALASIY